MMMHKKSIRPLALGLMVLGAVVRLTPHPPNFAPVDSLSLFSGARLRGWIAYLLPLVVMAITDPLVGHYSAATPFVYASFLLSVWIGTRLRASQSFIRVGLAAVICSAQFFVISNFGVWLGTSLYPHTAAGLAACYVSAIPFYGATLASDVLWTGVLFGLHAWLSRMVATGERVPQAA
jgi:hypothetical protein